MPQDIYGILEVSPAEIDVYVRRISDQFKLNDSFVGTDRSNSARKYVILTTSRTGTTYLSTILSTYGLGYPLEYISKYLLQAENFVHAEDQGENWDIILDRIVRRHKTGDIFGIKVGIADLIPYLDTIQWPGGFDDWSWIYVTREDIVQQAISLAKAEQTGAWISPQSNGVLSNLKFDPDHIVSLISFIQKDMRRIEAFFSHYNLSPLRLTYNEISGNVVKCCARVAAHLQTPMPQRLCDPEYTLVKQADAIDYEWRALMETYLANLPEEKNPCPLYKSEFDDLADVKYRVRS